MAVPLVALAVGWLAKYFTFSVAKYVAMRAFIIALVMGLGPIVIFNGFGLVLKFASTYGVKIMNAVTSQAGIPSEGLIVDLFGVGAYLGSLLRVGEGISIYLSFLALKFVWSLLPKFGAGAGLVR